MQRVLGLAIFATVVLLCCAAEATELRELLQELLDERSNNVDRHNKFLKAQETITRGTAYVGELREKLATLQDETLKPICKKFVGGLFNQQFINIRQTLKSSKDMADYFIKNNPGKRLTNMLRELLSDVEKEENRSDATVNPGDLKKEIIKDLRAVTGAFSRDNLKNSDNLTQDRQDLVDLISSVSDMVDDAVQVHKKCKAKRFYYL